MLNSPKCVQHRVLIGALRPVECNFLIRQSIECCLLLWRKLILQSAKDLCRILNTANICAIPGVSSSANIVFTSLHHRYPNSATDLAQNVHSMLALYRRLRRGDSEAEEGEGEG